ncbi:MAG: hypothetical protein KC516_00575 [Nanoarchaeota archaeon]|nr:hypothetical protein [Nanoarchaeota archaeon]
MTSKKFQEIFRPTKKVFPEKKDQEKRKIIIDHREKNSLVPSELLRLNSNVEFQQLKVADYVVDDVAIERKTFSDLISSMINKRIFKQMEELRQFPKPLLILEGYSNSVDNGISLRAIRSFILSIALRYKIPIIFTEDSKETAEYLEILSRKKPKEVSLNINKIGLSKNERLQFILEAFPNIGPKTARKLLEEKGSLKEIINSSEEELKKILGKKSEEVFEIINRKYKD